MTRDLKIDYPVAIDNDYAIWRAFNNQCWPAHYFIDAKGRIRYHHFGEGDYDESERRSSANGACPAIGRWTQNMVPSTRKTEPSCTGFMRATCPAPKGTSQAHFAAQIAPSAIFKISTISALAI